MTPHVGAERLFPCSCATRMAPARPSRRLFSPVLGIAEDPVSGNAHGMLGAYLVVNGLLPVRERPDAAARLPGPGI